MRRPVDDPVQITTNFGDVDPNALYGLHSGYDYAKPVGSIVHATTEGKIISTINHPTRGQMVTLYDGKYYHRFMHNSKFNCSAGDSVKEGDVISYSGGAAGAFGAGLSTGPHVHWDMNTRGVDTNGWSDFVDPDDWLKGRIPAASIPAAPIATGLLGYQRQVHASDTVNYRKEPNTAAEVLHEYPANDIMDFKGWVNGENIGGNSVWFVGRYSGGYSWSGAFNDTAVHDLSDLNVTTVPVTVTPAPTPVPAPAPVVTTPDVTQSNSTDYTFTKDLDCVTQVIPAGIGSFQSGNFPDRPQKVVLHDFGTEGKDTLQSTVAWFKKADNVAAHFVVSGKNIVQMVALKDRAYHAGPNGNDFIGIESDPKQDSDTINSVRAVLAQLEARYGYQLPVIKHSSIMATLCGDDINLSNYDIHTVVTPTQPTPTAAPVQTTPSDSVTVGSLDARVTKLERNQGKLIDVVKTFE